MKSVKSNDPLTLLGRPRPTPPCLLATLGLSAALALGCAPEPTANAATSTPGAANASEVFPADAQVSAMSVPAVVASPTSDPSPARAPFERTWVNHPSSVAGCGATSVPIVSAGRVIKASPLEGQPGYPKPSAEESYYIREGRLPAPAIDAELANGYPSAATLAEAILEGVNENDVEALRRLIVSFDEFETILWPEFPESRPATKIRAEDAWDFLFRGNLSGSSRGVHDWANKYLTLDHLSYEVGLTPHSNFNLYRGLTIHAKTDDGRAVALDFTRTIVERNGRWKVYRYSDRPLPPSETAADPVVPGH